MISTYSSIRNTTGSHMSTIANEISGSRKRNKKKTNNQTNLNPTYD